MGEDDIYKAQGNGLTPDEEEYESAGKEKSQDERNTENNAKNINNAANVAIKSGVPVAAAVGAAVKGADKITGGKITKVAGKLFTEFNKMVPLGDKLQGVSNQISESGVSDAIGAIAAVDKGEKVQKAVEAGERKLTKETEKQNDNVNATIEGLDNKPKKQEKKKKGLIRKIITKPIKIALITGAFGFLFLAFVILLIILSPNLGSMLDLTSKGSSSSGVSNINQTSDTSLSRDEASAYNYPSASESDELTGESLLSKIGADGIAELESKIKSAVGSGCTGKSVAKAAIALIDGLHAKGIRIPYYYGGGHTLNNKLVDPEWGGKTSASQVTPKGNVYYYKGLDCGGFISWTMQAANINAVFAISTVLNNDTKISFTSLSAGDVVGNNSHVMLVLENDGNILTLAEATGGGVQYSKKTYAQCSDYNAIDMDAYYAANCKNSGVSV